jgi:hypothetical protein
MPASRGFLERFRPSGTPGAAAGAGVPADRVAEREVELAALFEQLLETEALAAQIRAEGTARAEEQRSVSQTAGRQLVAAARHDAELVRREASSRVAAQSDHETTTTLAEAEEEAARIRRHAAGVRPDYARRVVQAVLADLGLPPGPPAVTR